MSETVTHNPENHCAGVVAKARRSPSAIDKEPHGTTPDGLPVHSFQSLLDAASARVMPGALWSMGLAASGHGVTAITSGSAGPRRILCDPPPKQAGE